MVERPFGRTCILGGKRGKDPKDCSNVNEIPFAVINKASVFPGCEGVKYTIPISFVVE